MQTTIELANALLKRIEQEIQDHAGNTDNLEDAQNLLLDAISALQSHAERIEEATAPVIDAQREWGTLNFVQTGVTR